MAIPSTHGNRTLALATAVPSADGEARPQCRAENKGFIRPDTCGTHDDEAVNGMDESDWLIQSD